MQLSLSQQLDLERLTRAIDACDDLPQLRHIAQELARAWMIQQAAARWAITHRPGTPWVAPSSASEAPMAAPAPIRPQATHDALHGPHSAQQEPGR